MASINVTCTACRADEPCERCRSILRALRAAGHSITQSSRYDALRAATVGTYGFDACVIPVARDEKAIVDAAAALLTRARVALIVEPGARAQICAPQDFAVIEAGDWRGQPFPTDWLSAPGTPQVDPDETRSFEELNVPPADVNFARRRLKGIARNALRDLGAAGFPDEVKLDLLAALEDEIAWAKMSGACFGIVLIHLAKPPVRAKAIVQAQDIDRALALLRQHVEPVIRSGDVVSLGRDSLLIVLGDAALDQVDVAKGRIKKALRKALKDMERDRTLSSTGRVTLGAAVYPTHGTTRAALLARATAAAATI